MVAPTHQEINETQSRIETPACSRRHGVCDRQALGSGDHGGGKSLAPFTTDIFKGMLCLFLLDMGIISARRLSGIGQMGVFPVGFALCMPLVNAGLGIAVAHWIGMGRGDALLFTVLCASASYIAVPAAMRMAVPEANPGLYVTMALAITFPFNILVGLPIYMGAINHFWS